MSEMNAPKRVSRRTIAKGAAWTVPAIAVAAPVANAAVSPFVPVDPEFTGNWCKHPGNPKYYHNTMKWENLNDDCPVTVTLGSMTIGTDSRQAYASIDSAMVTTFEIPAGGTVCFYIDGGEFDNSQNTTANLAFTWTINCPAPELPVSGSGSVGTPVGDDNALPPCGTGADDGGNPGGNPPHANISC